MKTCETLKELVAFSLIKDAGPMTFKKLTEAFGDIERVFETAPAKIRQVKGIPKHFPQALREPELFERADKEIERAQKAGVDIISLSDKRYPEELKNIYDPPYLLYVRGKLPSAETRKVAVVGARQASLYGGRTAKTMARELAEAGVCVVSGMARGIDSFAHEGALSAGGLTVAVLGGGLSRIYPPENNKLADRIAEKGAVISEYPMTMPPLKQHFPVRNRIISGLCQAVVVVEAKEKSGALITVDSALEQGREVFAVPGNVDSPRSGGSNKLLKQGAQIATSARDILDALDLSRRKPEQKNGIEDLLDDLPEGPEKDILTLVGTETVHVDEVIDASGLKPAEVMSILSVLEIRGILKQLPGKHFAVKS